MPPIRAVADEYVRRGVVVREVADHSALETLRDQVVCTAHQILGIASTTSDRIPVAAGGNVGGASSPRPVDPHAWLEGIHLLVDPEDLNDLKMALMARLGEDPAVRSRLWEVARPHLEELLGSELAVQRRPNLSVHLAGDATEALAIHADTWSGHSPFEVVVWVPLTDARATQAMYVLERPADAVLRRDLARRSRPDAEGLYEMIAPAATWVEVGFGSVVLFDPGLLHGTRPNVEAATRWSFNCRFKALFTPYGDKGLGDYFEPVALSPVTRTALRYRHHGVR